MASQVLEVNFFKLLTLQPQQESLFNDNKSHQIH